MVLEIIYLVCLLMADILIISTFGMKSRDKEIKRLIGAIMCLFIAVALK